MATEKKYIALQDDLVASKISYDNTESGLEATNVESAIDEINTELSQKITEPATDGSDGQVLATDGSGNRSWVSIDKAEVKNGIDLVIAEETADYTLADVALGTVVHIKEDGTFADYKVVEIDTENSQVIVLRVAGKQKGVISSVTNATTYFGTTADTWCTTTFYNQFSDYVKQYIEERFISARYNNTTGESYTEKRKIYLPSATEVGTQNNSYEGTSVWFTQASQREASPSCVYWLRTSLYTDWGTMRFEAINGQSRDYFNCNESNACYYRPAICFSINTPVNESTKNIDGTITYTNTIDKLQDGNNYYKFADQDARADIAAIQDGTSIDSFADVETELSGKQDTLTAGTGIDITNDVISVTSGGSSSTQPDWNQNNTSAADYVKNRTHYISLRTELSNLDWDGDFASENAPTIVDSLDDSEGSGYVYRLYKISDDPTNFDIKTLQSAYDIYSDGTVSVDTVGTYADLVKAVVMSYYYYSTGSELTDEMYEQLASQMFDLESLEPVILQVGANDGDAYFIVYGSESDVFDYCRSQVVFVVNEPGTYDPISLMTGGSTQSSKSYTAGIYGVSNSEPGDAEYHTAYTPLYAAGVVKLDDKFLPDSIETRFNQLGSKMLAYSEFNLVEDTNNPGSLISTKTAAEIYTMFQTSKIVFVKHPLIQSEACKAVATTWSGGSVTSITLQTQPYVDGGDLYCRQYVITGNAVTASVIQLVDSLTIGQETKTLSEWITAQSSQKVNKPTTDTITLDKDDWVSNEQTVSVTGVTATNLVQVAPSPTSYSDYGDAEVRCTTQGTGTLTFECASVPTTDIDVNVIVWEV